MQQICQLKRKTLTNRHFCRFPNFFFQYKNYKSIKIKAKTAQSYNSIGPPTAFINQSVEHRQVFFFYWF